MPHAFELSPEKMCKICDPSSFSFSSTAELPPFQEIIGQDRAAQALEFGIDIPSYGFNIYALGPSGVGKTTAVRQFLSQRARNEPVADDWCYVHNFADPRRPRALRLPAGRGCQLRSDMEELLNQIRIEIPRAFESDYYTQRQSELIRELQEQQREEFAKLESYVQERGFALLRTPMGLIIAPVLNGEVLSPEQYEQLPPEVKQRFESQRPELQDALEKATRRARELEKASKESSTKLNTEVAMFAVGHLINELKEKYADQAEVIEYLTEVQKDVVDNVDRFRPQEAPRSPIPLPGIGTQEDLWFNRYKVNVIVDNCNVQGAPVVVESNPTYFNLIGTIEYQALFGAWITDFTMIKAGALHRANGGYLVVDAQRLLLYPYAWDALKRALRTQSIKIEEMGQEFRVIATSTLEPEPIPLNVKVIVIGRPDIYYILYGFDEEFRKLFKVKADFDSQIPWSQENLQKYAFFIANRCNEEGLLHFDPSGVARVIEHGARLAENQEKLTTRFADIADLVREASYWAKRRGKSLVTAEDVQQAIDAQVHRSNRIEERLRELIREGTILIDTEGEVVGQVNGLAIINIGDYQFGRPSRITAKTYWGQSGVINIDREVKLTESIHDKGVLILSSYLNSKYAQDKPLSLSASITFEQGYEGVAGDSASSTELYALLSSISGLPIKQSIAVTGSVNQHGEIQPIGGVTHKVEGFFDVCVAKGLTGDQGVMIPAQNVRNLMLRRDVIEAVREGKFHIYAVSTIDEGISVLTGVEAGERREDGTYPEGTVNYLVDKRLAEMAEKVREYGKGKERADETGSSGSEENEDESSAGDEDTPA